ncbi:MAG: tyrosine-type recombinase/integrase [Rhodobacteraceae bacterium]|nr:tyrosine-type recombinase/integrase [Paracoccaceae bacterium]
MTLRVKIVHARGRRYVYTATPPRVRLPDLPFDHPEFLAAYARATSGAVIPRRIGAGTIAAAAALAAGSARFKMLAPAYRRAMRAEFDAILEQADDALIADLRPADIRDDLRPLAPHAARKRRKAWRMICAAAIEAQLIAEDPSATVKPPAPPRTDGHEPWSPDEVERFRARWPVGTQQRAMMELMHWTGARISDAVRLGPGMVDGDGVLTFRQGKTGGQSYVPWTCPLPPYAAGMAADRAAMHAALGAIPRHMTFLSTAHGKSRSTKAAASYLSQAAQAAGLTDRTGHGLRKARAIALAESGATTHQIGAWTGHATLAEIERYTRKASRRAAVMGTEQDRNTGKRRKGSGKQ